MDILRIWKDEEGHTMREMGRRAGCSGSHICRVLQGKKSLSKNKIDRINQVRKLEKIIRSKPADILFVKYELEKLINGCSL